MQWIETRSKQKAADFEMALRVREKQAKAEKVQRKTALEAAVSVRDRVSSFDTLIYPHAGHQDRL